MKSASFALDRRIFELFQSGRFERFTPRGLRDAYAQAFAVPHEYMSDLRRYVFRQILRLQKVGWVTQVPERKSRDQVYQLLPQPPSVTLRLAEEGYRPSSEALDLPLQTGQEMTSSTDATGDSTTTQLQAMVKEVRLDFLSSMGEAECYKQLLEELPQLKSKVEGDYIEARDRSSRLLGHLRAIEKTLKTLGAE
jgi:hypothetical protein